MGLVGGNDDRGVVVDVDMDDGRAVSPLPSVAITLTVRFSVSSVPMIG